MNKLFLALLLCGSCVPLTGGVANASRSHQLIDALQNQQSSAEQSKDLAEASRLTMSAMKLYQARDFDAALPLARRVLEITERVLPQYDEQVVLALINLGEIHFARGRAEEAKPFFERALKAYVQTLGPNDLKLSRVLDSLALVYYAMGRPADTEKAYKQSLEIREQVLGSEQPDVAKSISRLADFYQYEGDYKKAQSLYQRLIEIRVKLTPNSAALAEALNGYACLLRKTKQDAEAEHKEASARAILKPLDPSISPVNVGVVEGKALSLPVPVYPFFAKSAHVTGEVAVRVLIDESGAVIHACAVEGPKALMKTSEAAAYRARFSPTLLEGKPVQVIGKVTYRFKNQ